MDAATRAALHARLEKIRARNNGVLTPDDVVKDARSETSPLHPYFTWDDSEAANQYRLDQARLLIRNVRVEVMTSTTRVVAPFYVRDPRMGSGEQGYAAVAEIRDEASVAAEALRYEFDRAIGILERAVSVAEALGMADRVAELLQRAKAIQVTIPVAATKKTEEKKRPRQKVAV